MEVVGVAVGPVEIVTIGFEQGRFDGSILEELTKVVDSGTITLIDGVVVRKSGEHEYDLAELTEIPELHAIAARVTSVLTDEDVDTVAEDLPVGSAAAVLVFEHTWVLPLRDAIVNAGGVLLDSVRIPGLVVDEVLEAIAADEEE